MVWDQMELSEKLGVPRSSSYINSYVSSYCEQKSCYVPSVPFDLLVPSSF